MFGARTGWLALVLPLVVNASESSPKKGEPVVLTGRVLELTAALNSTGLTFDKEPIARQVVLQDRDGTITPLLSDDASRAFFLDERLRDRSAEIQARHYPGLPYLQVISFRIEENGRLRTPEYYCEICTISVRFPQSCPCCQGPMELRMRPEPR